MLLHISHDHSRYVEVRIIHMRVTEKEIYCKLQNPRHSHPPYSYSNINTIIPYSLKSSFSIAKNLKQHKFKIFLPNLSVFKLQNPRPQELSHSNSNINHKTLFSNIQFFHC